MSRRKNKTDKTEELITVKDLVYSLGLLPEDVVRWLRQAGVEPKRDYMNRPAVKKDYLEKLSVHPEYRAALKKALEGEAEQRKRDKEYNEINFKGETVQLINSYREMVAELEEMHRKYLERVNRHDYESAVVAAYLLVAKAISCLKMGLLGLEHGFWGSGSLLREIDETLDTAHYFIVVSASDLGKKALHKWFRENVSPQHSVCRKVLAEHMASIIPGSEMDAFNANMSELYHKKSKWVHPTYLPIREITDHHMDQGIALALIEYGKTSHSRKLYELTDFFRSSIWTCFQVFTKCFAKALPLDDDDITFLLEYNKRLENWV